MYPKAFLQLISFFKKLPGVGTKTAERFVFEILNFKNEDINNFGDILKNIKEKILTCKKCNCLIESNFCSFCDSISRDTNKMCILSNFKDVVLIEKTGVYKGLYHILKNLISPLNGHDFESIDLKGLKERVVKNKIEEIILGLDSTLEGDTTALFIKENLKEFNIKISRFAFGLPMGTSLDFIDKTTLLQALIDRKPF
ncbi:MAG: recombination protein RecR [Chlamydiae bacterium RIFCSPLOWO2_01_FULL_28_7]|nr:MAG: recombination protein RecR [Chlamydiae bacterium RIFCSPLOWO2_01_FULL_28_7]